MCLSKDLDIYEISSPEERWSRCCYFSRKTGDYEKATKLTWTSGFKNVTSFCIDRAFLQGLMSSSRVSILSEFRGLYCVCYDYDTAIWAPCPSSPMPSLLLGMHLPTVPAHISPFRQNWNHDKLNRITTRQNRPLIHACCTWKMASGSSILTRPLWNASLWCGLNEAS